MRNGWRIARRLGVRIVCSSLTRCLRRSYSAGRVSPLGRARAAARRSQLVTTRREQRLRAVAAIPVATDGARWRSREAGEILLTSGCQQALDLLRQTLLQPGDEVVIENPTYPGALSLFCQPQYKFIGVPVGARGLDLDALEDALRQRRPKLIYVVPTFHNPTGVTMDLASRRRLIELAAQYRVPIVEDEIYRDLRYGGASLPSLKALDRYGVVIYLNSFSKVGFRLARRMGRRATLVDRTSACVAATQRSARQSAGAGGDGRFRAAWVVAKTSSALQPSLRATARRDVRGLAAILSDRSELDGAGRRNGRLAALAGASELK